MLPLSFKKAKVANAFFDKDTERLLCMLLAIVDQVRFSVFSYSILIARDDADTLDSPLASATNRLYFLVHQYQVFVPDFVQRHAQEPTR